MKKIINFILKILGFNKRKPIPEPIPEPIPGPIPVPNLIRVDILPGELIGENPVNVGVLWKVVLSNPNPIKPVLSIPIITTGEDGIGEMEIPSVFFSTDASVGSVGCGYNRKVNSYEVFAKCGKLPEGFIEGSKGTFTVKSL